MKKIWMVMFIFLAIECVYGQNERKHYFGACYSFGACFYKDFTYNLIEKELDGKNYHSAGLEYRYRFREKTELGLGLMWGLNQLNDRRFYYDKHNYNYLITPVNVLSIPVSVKYHFQKYFFIGGGPCLNYHPWFENWKWGIGLELNFGIEYVFQSGLTISVTPRGQINMLNLSGNKNSSGIEKDILSQIGIGIGLGYKFGK